MADYKALCEQIIEKTGGKENIKGAFHCMTRLRLTLADNSKVDIEGLKAVPKVLGAQFSGEQFQVIIGPTVGQVYKDFCDITGLSTNKAVDENLDANLTEGGKKPFNIKDLPSAALDYLSGSVAPCLPIMLGAGFFRMFYSLLGSGLLNVLPDDSAFMQSLNAIGNTGFYFLPIFVAWAAAKKRKTNIQMALVLSALLLAPEIRAIVEAGNPFLFYGAIPMQLNDYSSAVLPPLLLVWALSYVYPFVDKYMPKSLKVIGTPFVTLIVMAPLTLCGLAPLGSWVGKVLTMIIGVVYQYAGPLAVGLIGALWMFMIATGMHIAVIQMAIINMMTAGNDPVVLAGSTVANYALMGLALAYFIRSKGEEKQMAVVKELQFHPISGRVLHIDFLAVDEKKPVTVSIPVKLEGLAEGVKAGGKLALQARKLKVNGIYTQIPNRVVVDVTSLGLGKKIAVADIQLEGLKLMNPADMCVAEVKATRQSKQA